jgi:UTP-glucose-1-phosphate uridylyltransferase
MELGANGMLTGLPATKAAVEEVLPIGTMVGMQVVVAALHPVEVT